MFTLQSQNPWLKSTKNLIEKMEENEKFSFRKELYAFLNNTVCHCYRHLAQVDRSNAERQGNLFQLLKVSLEIYYVQVYVGNNSFNRSDLPYPPNDFVI